MILVVSKDSNEKFKKFGGSREKYFLKLIASSISVDLANGYIFHQSLAPPSGISLTYYLHIIGGLFIDTSHTNAQKKKEYSMM